MKKIIEQALISQANAKKGIQISKYMKNVLPFRGLQAPQIQLVYNQLKPELQHLNQIEKLELANELIRNDYGEDKKFGLMIVESIPFTREQIIRTQDWFTQRHIREWATSDTYCSKILKRYLVDQDNATLMEEWAKHENLWIRRCSCVGFVTVIRKHDVDFDMLLRICQINILSQERFNQLGTGWLLREMAQKELPLVLAFITNNIQHFSTEGLSYAIEKMSKNDQASMRSILGENKKLSKRKV